MKGQNFKKEYRDLETKVLSSLRDEVNKSEYESKHVQAKAVKINFRNYTEISVIYDRLTFLDEDGHHYSIFADCSLEDLIDILNSISAKPS